MNPKAWSDHGRYLLAQCCTELGKYDEAKNALLDQDKRSVRLLYQLDGAKLAKTIIFKAVKTVWLPQRERA